MWEDVPNADKLEKEWRKQLSQRIRAALGGQCPLSVIHQIVDMMPLPMVPPSMFNDENKDSTRCGPTLKVAPNKGIITQVKEDPLILRIFIIKPLILRIFIIWE